MITDLSILGTGFFTLATGFLVTGGLSLTIGSLGIGALALTIGVFDTGVLGLASGELGTGALAGGNTSSSLLMGGLYMFCSLVGNIYFLFLLVMYPLGSLTLYDLGPSCSSEGSSNAGAHLFPVLTRMVLSGCIGFNGLVYRSKYLFALI